MKHIEKRKHFDVLPYFTNLEEIIKNPDYVGINPNEKDLSLEYVKVYEDNVLVAVKIHKSQDYFYIPTMYIISEYKLKSRVYGGRLKKFDNK